MIEHKPPVTNPSPPAAQAGPGTLPGLPLLDLSQEQWNKEQKEGARPWNSTPEGRAAIRLFSRGVLGAAAFTFGGWYASRAVGLKVGANGHYTPENWDKTKPLQWIAKGIDTFVGEPIKTVVNALGHDGEAAVRFRPTVFKCTGRNTGRTLGEEAVGITFDFAMASYGDALGRDLADTFDPNVKKDWINDDGSINWEKATKTAGKSVFRYLTYNGGEDWAVAIPYAYWMKGTRSLWNNAFPGFKYDFDRSLNGGSFRVDHTGGNIIGNFSLPGLLNLWERFTVYNVGTLMFREGYDYAGKMLSGEHATLYGSPEKTENRGILGNLEDFAKWTARSAIKGTLYMVPAVPFFWMTRTPQSKYKGTFINSENDALLCYQNGEKFESVRATELWRHHGKGAFTENTPVFFRQYRNHDWSTHMTGGEMFNPLRTGHIDPYGQSFGVLDSTLNALGKANNTIARSTHGLPQALGIPVNQGAYTRIANRYVNAAIAYTPYMYAKAEFARQWDNGRMDIAAERMVDGASSLNWKEFTAGACEVWNTLWKKPLDDPQREKEAQRRIELDTSASDAAQFPEGRMAPSTRVLIAATHHGHEASLGAAV